MRINALAAVLVAVALVVTACGGDSASTTTAADTTITTTAPSTTAPDTIADPAPDATVVAQVITDYLEATLAGDFATSQALSTHWAYVWERFLEIDEAVNDIDSAFEAEVAVDLDTVGLSASGLSVVASGDVTVTIDGGEGGQDFVITFPEWVLMEREGELLVVDYLVETPEAMGPVVGALSDLVGYDPQQQELDGVTVELGPAVRSAGSGPSYVTFTVYVTNSTDTTVTVYDSIFETGYTLDGDTAVMPDDGVVSPTIPPGGTGWAEITVNKPETMAEGRPAGPGTLDFAIVDVDDPDRIWRFELTTPSFPTEFSG